MVTNDSKSRCRMMDPRLVTLASMERSEIRYAAACRPFHARAPDVSGPMTPRGNRDYD